MARLQTRSETRNAFFGDNAEEIAALLTAWETSWVDTSLVTERGGQIVGFIGAELDESLGRVWIHGPVVAVPDWDGVADALLAALDGALPAMPWDRELAGDVANAQLAVLASRHGFVAGEVHHVLTLGAASVEDLPASSVSPLSPSHEQAFFELHAQLFPGTYYSGPQLLGQAARGEADVLGLADGDELVGYVAGRIDEGGDGYIDFVGVARDRRREGHGALLVAAISRALAERAAIAAVRLTVSCENRAALVLYDTLGFVRTSSAVGYRRRVEPSG